MPKFLHRLVQFVLFLVVGAGLVALSALVAGRIVEDRLAAALRSGATPAPQLFPAESGPTEEVDFHQACGIRPDELQTFLAQVAERDHLPGYPAHLTFRNARGDYLVDRTVELRWTGGGDRLTIGRSGVLRIMLRKEVSANLKLRVPAGYRDVAQHTIPLGTAYRPHARPDAPGPGRFVVDDFETAMTLWRALARQQASRQGLSSAQWREQIIRKHCNWRPPPSASSEASASLDAAEIFRRRRDSVVILGHLMPDGEVVHAAGVFVDASGIIATAYHVVDKESAVARGAMTTDGRTFPVEEILAADRASDVALLRIAGDRFTAAPLSTDDAEGAPLVILSHPGGEFFSVTQGHLRRYQSSILYGTAVLQMTVTADFTDGASGGPVFNHRGEIAGLVSFRNPTGAAEWTRVAAPACSLLKLTNVVATENRP